MKFVDFDKFIMFESDDYWDMNGFFYLVVVDFLGGVDRRGLVWWWDYVWL